LAEEGRGMSHTTVHQVLRTQGFTGYHERRVHELLPEDYPRRVEMARTLLRMMDEDPTLIEKIIWTDEAKFTLSGAVNSHITIYWSRTNPHRTRETRRVDQRGVMVWVGMHANGIDGTLTGAKYHDLLEQQILPNIDTSGHWWMQDGAPAHGTRVVKDLLSSFFDERVIALGWDPEWAPRSPDLTPCDFHLWGTLKDMVYGKRHETLDELKAGIWDQIETYSEENIRNACLGVRRRLEDCVTQNGGHVQFQRGK